MQVEVSFLRFFETPTVSGMARSIETARQADQGEAVPSIEPIPRQGALPASVAQEQLWFIDRALSESSFFNVPYVMRLTGALNEAALARSFNEIVKRHEALRTNFATVHGRLVQTISPTLHVPLTVEDLHTSPETEWEEGSLAAGARRSTSKLQSASGASAARPCAAAERARVCPALNDASHHH